MAMPKRKLNANQQNAQTVIDIVHAFLLHIGTKECTGFRGYCIDCEGYSQLMRHVNKGED